MIGGFPLQLTNKCNQKENVINPFVVNESCQLICYDISSKVKYMSSPQIKKLETKKHLEYFKLNFEGALKSYQANKYESCLIYA